MNVSKITIAARIKAWVLERIGDITSLIPSQASSSNQLADKAFVNSSVATSTATFRGTYNLVSDLGLTTSATHAQIATKLGQWLPPTFDNNDYCFVQIPTADATPTQIAKTEKYKFNGTTWAFEYVLNNSGFTAAQWAAINSSATLELIGKLSALPTNAELTALIAAKQDVIQDLATIRSGASAGATAVQPATLNPALSVVAEALLYLYNENKALRELLTGKDNAVLPVVKAQSVECDDILTLGVPNVLYSSVEGAPSAANVPDNWNEDTMTVWNGCPRKIGQQYVDKVNKKVYCAVAVTGSTNDWVALN